MDRILPSWVRPYLKGPSEQWSPLVKFGITKGLVPAAPCPLDRPASDYDTFQWYAQPAATYCWGRDIPTGARIFTDGSLLDSGWIGYQALG